MNKMETLSPVHLRGARRVVVIGAGMAGLAAAQRLAAEGIAVTVIEGRDRIGGRIHTQSILPEGPSLDMGAAWIHGVEGNPVSAMCEAYGLNIQPFGSDFLLYGISGTTITFDASGRALTTVQLRQRHAVFVQLYEHLQRTEASTVSGVSLSVRLDRLMDVLKVDVALRPLMQAAIARVSEDDFGADSDQLAGWALSEGGDVQGGDAVISSGYSTLVQRLSEGLDIRFGETVETVRYDDQGISLSTQRQVFEADAVVVTVPLGVLKANAIRFEPALPAPKQAAITRLGMGAYNKLWLCFDRVFWPDNIDILCRETGVSGRWNAWYAMNKVGKGAVLCALFGGSTADAIEREEEEVVLEEALAVLRQIFSDRVGTLKGHHVTRWRQDPFARGAYSYAHVATQPEDRQHLAAPIGARVFFAGEATSPLYSATVHGAYASGLRAAAEYLSVAR